MYSFVPIIYESSWQGSSKTFETKSCYCGVVARLSFKRRATAVLLPCRTRLIYFSATFETGLSLTSSLTVLLDVKWITFS